jgi:hypothetical protein
MRSCGYYLCDNPVFGREHYCGEVCRSAAAKDRAIMRADTQPAEKVEPERVLQLATEALLRDLVRAGQIVCWYHVPPRLGTIARREERGYPDLTIKVRRGERAVHLELKQKGQGLRPEQEQWIDGGEGSAVCWTLDEVRAALRGWGVRC